MEVNEAPVEPQSHALPEPAGENKSFPCNHRKTVPSGAAFWFGCLHFYPAKEPRKVKLGLGVRAWVARSTATRPKVMEKPFCHSKLSRRDQWK